MTNFGTVMHGRSKGYAIPVALLCLTTLQAPQASAQSSPSATAAAVTVNFVTANSTPLNPGFNGFNSNLQNAVEPFDLNFQQMVMRLSPGWLRYPGGTESEAFDWVSGKIVPAWVDGLAAKPYTHDTNAAALPIVDGKGGWLLSDFAALAANVGGAKIIVSVNAYTDTPQSAQAFAQYALTHHIPVAAWELANEPYTWLKTAGEPGAFFTDATDYANKMRPYRDAIKAADANAVVTLYFSEAGNPTKSWDNALASYSPKYWDAVTYHEYVFPGSLTDFNDLMAAANGNLFSNTTSYVTEYLAPKNNPGMMYVISEVSPAGGQGGPLLGTLYGGIYTVEFALRMSTLPQVKYVAAFQILSNAGIDDTNGHLQDVQNAYANGTTTNTSGLNFGFFLSAQAAGEAVANGALRNSTRVYGTTVTGGPMAPRDGGGSIPGIYAQAYEGSNGKRYVVLTNKSASAATAQIMQDGAALTSAMQMTFVSGADPTLSNSGPTASPVQIQTQAVASPGAVTIPAYSVSRLEWCVLAGGCVSMTPAITAVANAEGESPTIAPNTWVEIKGENLAPAGDARTWQESDFVGGQMPTQLDHVSATVNGKSAYVYYISPGQINILTPPNPMNGSVQVVVNNNGAISASYTARAQDLSPSFFVFGGGPYVAAQHNGTYALLGPRAMSVPGYVFTPAKPGEPIIVYANGFGPTSVALVSGSRVQGGTLSTLPVVKIGGTNAFVQYAGLITPGLFQFNVTVPANTPDGDQAITATYNGLPTQSGTLLTVQH
jgi:uncharacterized protein (TIGR03437 family)